MRSKKYTLDETTARIERAIEWEVSRVTTEPFSVTHYGANDIDPLNLVYWIVVQTDAEKQRLTSDESLMETLRKLLDLYDYPAEGRGGVHIGFESHETVNRESGGDFWRHWR